MRPPVLVAVLGVAVLIVASLVTMGIESQSKGGSHPPPNAGNAAPKRTQIAPVTITIDADAKKAKAAEEKTSTLNPKAPVEAFPPPARSDEATSDVGAEDDQPSGDADDDVKDDDKSSGSKDGTHNASQKRKRSSRSREKAHEKTPEKKEPVQKHEVAEKPKKAEKEKATSGKQTGFLNVGAKPWAEISIDSQRWPYQTPQAGIELPVGKHTVTLSNRETGVTKSQTVQIQQGQYKTISMDMTKK